MRIALCLSLVALAPGCVYDNRPTRDGGAPPRADAGSAPDASAPDAATPDGAVLLQDGGTDAGRPDAGLFCSGGTHACAGECVSDFDPASCGDRCAPCPVPVGGTATCDGEVCGVECATGYNLCADDTCAADEAVEASCDDVDDDCDGIVDEGCASEGTCEAPIPVPAEGMVDQTYTISGGPRYGGSCDTSPGNARAHRWVPPRSGTATVRYTNDFWPATLVVWGGDCGGAELACQYESAAWPTLERTFSVTAGSPVVITVGHGTYTGDVTLTYHLTVVAP